MGAKASQLYQGADWLTYRWSVAQAFDTLDRLHDLCICRARDQFTDLSQLRVDQSHDTDIHLEDSDVLAGMSDLCDDLMSELAFAEADMQPIIRSNFNLHWATFEMGVYLCEIRKITSLHNHEKPQNSFDELLALIMRIKENLKRLDQ